MSAPSSPRPESDLRAIRDGDPVTFAAHLDRWVDRMHDASQDIVGTTDAAATVCHDVVQSLWERRGDLTADELSRDSLLLATRQRSLDHLAAHGWHPPSTDNLAGLHNDSSAIRYRVTLAHAAATVIGASNVSLLDLHFRHGVDAAALSDALGVADTAAPRRLAQLRSELDEAIAVYALWSGARPGCPGLGEATEFDATVFETVRRHRSTCPECAREHRSIVNPAGLFLTAPITTVAPALRQRVLSVASDRDALSAATVAAPIVATTLDDAGAAAAAAVAAVAGEAQPAASPDLDELWASTAGAAPAPRFAPVTPSRPPARPRTATIVGGAMVVLAVVAGGAALATRGSDSGDRIVVDRGSNSEQPQTNEEEPEVQSLGPVPPSTERRTTSTSTAASTTTSTTSSTAPATEPPGTPATTTGTQVATGIPPRPTSTRPSTPTSTVASSPVTTTTAAEPTTTTATEPPTATTAAPTTAAPTTTPTATTTAPTTTEATTATTAAPTTTAPTTTEATTTTTTTTLAG